MPIPRIRIDQQFAQIGVRTAPATLNISIPRGQISIQNVRAQVNIDTQIPTFRVNSAKTNSEMGLKPPPELARDFRDKGRQAASSATAQAKNDGNHFANHRVPARDKVPSLSRNKTMARLGPKEYNVGLMPKSQAELQWTNGYVNMDWTKHNVIIDYNGQNTAEISADTNYPVEVFLQRQPYFRVTVEDVGSSGRYA